MDYYNVQRVLFKPGQRYGECKQGTHVNVMITMLERLRKKWSTPMKTCIS